MARSRTLQRRKQILQTVGTGPLHDRPGTSESIHQTSIASDLSDDERFAELKTELQELYVYQICISLSLIYVFDMKLLLILNV